MLGVFRKRSPSEETIPEDLLESVPEIAEPAAKRATLVPVVVPDAPDANVLRDARGEVEHAWSRVADAFGDMEKRMKSLEIENARLLERLREAEAKAAILDEVRGALSKAGGK